MNSLTAAAVIGPWGKSPDLTSEIHSNISDKLVPAVNKLLGMMAADGVVPRLNPVTATIVSGTTLGGFRPQNAGVGAPKSNHKRGLAVDLYDPDGALDAWCMKHQDKLAACGLYLENPAATIHWCHLQCVPPGSGVRVFNP